jgi:TonB family protein
MRALLRSAIVCGCLVAGLGELAAQPLMVHPVRVGGNIKPPNKIRDVRPVYPQIAQSARVMGIVILEITIGTDGAVTDARVLRGVPLLNDAALEAVKQWQYDVTLLNGTPVPVIMTVTVNFSIADRPNRADASSGMVGPIPGMPSSTDAPMPDATDAAGAAIANPNPYLIAPNRVGMIYVGMTAQLLFRAVPSTQIRPIPRRTPRGMSTDIEIALEAGGPTALVANLVDGHVLHI